MLLIRNKPIEGHGLSKWFCHAQPELLNKYAEAFLQTTNPVIRARCAREFSIVLDDLYIGGAWKRTQPGRLESSQNVLLNVLNKSVPPKKLNWLDVGASDGSTTVDMKQLLGEITKDVQTCMTDRYLSLRVCKRGLLTTYYNTRDEPILVRLGPLGLRLPYSPRRYDRLSSLTAAAYMACARKSEALLTGIDISLVNPIARNDPDIEIRELNILQLDEKLIDTFDLVRVSNVLNPGYFSPETIKIALHNVHRYLRNDGLLLVSRSLICGDEETECGVICRKITSGFKTILEFGDGTEMATILTELSVATVA